jgi:hypothetical protein
MKLPSGKCLLILGGMLVSLVSVVGAADDTGPETVKLESLAELYQPVEFNHAMHVELVDSECARCHHHTTGAAPLEPRCLECHKGGEGGAAIACRDCHPAQRFSAEYLAELDANPQLYHLDKPGLKGAYHRNCLACHQENGGPAGCQDCHERTTAGDTFFQAGVASGPTNEKAGH